MGLAWQSRSRYVVSSLERGAGGTGGRGGPGREREGHQYSDERLSVRLERLSVRLESVVVNVVVLSAPAEAITNTELTQDFWQTLGHLIEQTPTKECLFVLMDMNAQTADRMVGEDSGVLGAYGRDGLDDNGTHILIFTSDKNSLSRTRLAHVRLE